ncbi:NAD(P)-dependent alcohol dehydrogenase (plasmid) [Coraliomargarita sp. W4R53]
MDAETLPTTMVAWHQSQYGAPAVVTKTVLPVPTPGKGEVLLRIRATSLNSGDVHIMRGEPLILRTAFGFRRPKQAVRGMDAAATVVALGEGVSDFAVGDEVLGELPGGALAEYAVSPVARLVSRPVTLDPQTAAALPIAAGTALQALDKAGVASGHRVLVMGASGGVGTFTVQLAAECGADVWALCGKRNLELVRSLGASKVFDYKNVQPGSADLPDGTFDTVIDIAGSASLRSLRRLVRSGGSVVLVAGEGGRLLGPLGRLAAASILSIGSKRKLLPLAATPKREILNRLVKLVVAGPITPVIERVWPFNEADAALAHADAGHTVGKIVVAM